MSTPVAPHEFSPWDFWREADAAQRDAQLERQRVLIDGHPERSLGDHCFVSELASVDHDALRLGDRTYIAAGAYLTGELAAGADCSINPYTVIRGRVTLGDAVRIGAHTSILGFNHSMEPGTPVFRQPLTTRGIVIGDDVWTGSHAVILDGVTVGSHSVIAAGAVVTKDVPAGAIVAGNPARFLRWRVEPEDAEPLSSVAPASDSSSLGERVVRFGERVRADASSILVRSWRDETRSFVDRPGAAPTVRAQADAIEIADLLTRSAPPQIPADEQIRRLHAWQDLSTGVVAPLGPDGHQRSGLDFSDEDVAYHVLSTGYGLDLLGSEFPAELTWVTEATPEVVVEFCRGLPWATDAWKAGHHVDGFGTALLWTKKAGVAVPDGVEEALFGWLLLNADPRTGMWGAPTVDRGLLPVVNGFYRASRGTFAQFGVPLPHPERVVDTVLAHARDTRWFAPGMRNACNVLDVAHPLWLTRGSGHRTDDVRSLAERLLSDALQTWVPGQGFGFREPSATTRGLAETEPGLQGTEMWLAIVWYLADILGVSDELGYRPRGVHRPEPAASFGAIV
ncbi:acetyltransferase-like isoleucine patch superfamily enzyme [Microbacterium phyllosphaerae]|uniref:Acetyltransferase-like isoleucine patch superfamily enzyme n=1 Tax=Microbacterium phyllosphaerae TaxID=124798 RepID=A0ABS4WUZ5_9MICO|nr:acyltransferase [Microbacterium phyllosphaerae]MBP2379968.1 acetyltransferase-like isoleucine patch superfamily enzyme [Microbacterium phyllosphaerae]